MHPDGIWPKSGARPGDALFLTKPLGTGLVLAGHGKGMADAAEHAEAVRWMTTLNGAAADVLRPFRPNAVTDVTGFGLFGHAHEMAERSGVRIRIDAGAMPALDGALEVARAGVRTGGDPRNREFAPVEADGVPEELLALGYDAQTAGGLLISLPADKALSLEAEFRARELFLRRIGSVEDGAGVVVGSVHVAASRERGLAGASGSLVGVAADPDRRHRRDRAAHRLGPRLPALAGCQTDASVSPRRATTRTSSSRTASSRSSRSSRRSCSPSRRSARAGSAAA